MTDLFGACGYDDEARTAFATALRNSAALSVDTFLEHRTNFLEVGKLAIACALVANENPEALFNGGRLTWLHLLLDRLHASLNKWDQNRLSIITFNYDRVIEQFLSQALVSRFGLQLAQSAELLQRVIPIVHVHGSLGALPHFDGVNVRPYDPTLRSGILREAAAGIKIIHEGTADSAEFKRAHALLLAAESIVFIGFGYNKTNVERLDFKNVPNGVHVHGTSVGMTRAERVVARNNLGIGSDISDDGLLPADYLRNNRILGLFPSS